ncbi:MAG: DHHW family protein [Oscillospiraceae bacterium]|nr:DHHW family protein [Oscillospiraceae bacterium]
MENKELLDKRPEKTTEQDALLEIQMQTAKQSRITDILTIIAFLLVIFGFGIAVYLKPADTFSDQENRMLQQFPDISSEFEGSLLERIQQGKFLDRLIEGRFTADIAGFYADQFPVRNFFVGLKGMSEIGLLKKENNDVVLGSGGYIVKREPYPDYDILETNLDNLEKFASAMEARGIPFTLAAAGRPMDVLGRYLPANFPDTHDFWEHFHDQTAIRPALRFLNLLEPLRLETESSGDGQYYYKTDHHWTTLGAYYAYAEIMKSFGEEPRPLSAFTVEEVSDAFYGTTWSSAGMKWIQPDTMYYFRYPGDDSDYITTIRDSGESYPGFYNRSWLEKKDKYSSFIGGTTSGNNGWVSVNKKIADNADGGPVEDRERLLLIKDSFAHAVVPFLAYHYDLEIIDLRYFKDSAAKIVEEKNISRVLVLEHIGSYADGNIFGILNFGL